MTIWDKSPNHGWEHNEVTMANYLDLRAQNQSFEQLALYRWWSTNLTGLESPERIQGFLVTGNFFDAIGVKPMMGRGFYDEENQPGKDAVAVITYSLWQRHFGADPNIINKTITLNTISRTIIGVMPPRFNFPKGAEVYSPLALSPELTRNRMTHQYYILGRLKPGVSQQSAQVDVDTISARLEKQYSDTTPDLAPSSFPFSKHGSDV
jgi:putative ABC transport system permease protein